MNAGIYTGQITQQTYETLCELAGKVISAGYPVIVDATFLSQAHRQMMQDLSRRLEVPFVILKVEAKKKTLLRRIMERAEKQSDASEADIRVLDYQTQVLQPLNLTEQQHQVTVNTDGEINYLRVADDIHVKLQQLSGKQDQTSGSRRS